MANDEVVLLERRAKKMKTLNESMEPCCRVAVLHVGGALLMGRYTGHS